MDNLKLEAEVFDFPTKLPGEIPVKESWMLPYPEIIEVGIVETKEMTRIETGRIIHMIKYNGIIFVSEEVMAEINKKTVEK